MISFIIQGPTHGAPEFDSDYGKIASMHAMSKWTGQSVVQTDYTFTSQDSIDSLRKWYPGCEIIISCSTGDADDLKDVDQLFYYGQDVEAGLNKQILTSQAVKHATYDIVCKIRSDMIAGSNDLLWYVRNELESRQRYKRNEKYAMFKRFVFVLNYFSYVGLLYHPSDWMFLGLKEDVQSIFDIPLDSEDSGWAVGPEQYMCLRCMENNGFEKYIDYEWVTKKASSTDTQGRSKDVAKNNIAHDKVEYAKHDWWNVFYNNFYVLNTGWYPRKLTAKQKEVISNMESQMNAQQWYHGPGQSGLMCQKYPHRVGSSNVDIINHIEWAKEHWKRVGARS